MFFGTQQKICALIGITKAQRYKIIFEEIRPKKLFQEHFGNKVDKKIIIYHKPTHLYCNNKS